jgi:hypothetical protein
MIDGLFTALTVAFGLGAVRMLWLGFRGEL